MRIAIIGSRGFDNYKLVVETFLLYKSKITLLVSGGARGADTLGEKWAIEHGIETLIFPADWKTHGKKAGYIRNENIVKNCDGIIAFWDGVSRGTAHSLTLANTYGKPINLVSI